MGEYKIIKRETLFTEYYVNATDDEEAITAVRDGNVPVSAVYAIPEETTFTIFPPATQEEA